MRKWIAVLMGVMLVASDAAAFGVDGLAVTYVTGTVPGLNQGIDGSLDTTQTDTLVFQSGDSKFAIPFAKMTPGNIGKTPGSTLAFFRPSWSRWSSNGRRCISSSSTGGEIEAFKKW